jgi:hypothetical protein
VRTGEQPVDCALVLRTRPPSETIVSTIKTLYLELLARLNTVHLPELSGKTIWPLEEIVVLTTSKISSYVHCCQIAIELRSSNAAEILRV